MRTALIFGSLALGLSACAPSLRANLSVDYTRSNLIYSFQPDRGQGSSYFVGDTIRFQLATREAGYVTLVSLDPNGNSNVLVRNAYVNAGTTFFPRVQDGAASFSVAPPRGLQRVRAIFTRARPNLDLYFQGTYDQNRWNDATNNYVQSYNARDRDTQETLFYIR
ncbi:DUF4384 domain-containing protein [Deinococcus sp. KNUC1210]|uniref:DUF4384 domain-containing protein n=1 Tax=Deinococcus sp. KNUC1210 TaxID=2917691 RepID=UPI001EEFCC2B|nr:DUF4384 domain-containing protein [Deinococcus sp. KNUC1210]ULH14433.1 DUF4384 domain-containing protein [Deinococcus sp. KNUC1210]